MSRTKKSKHYSPKNEFKRGHKINLGRKHSKEWRKKVSRSWFKKGVSSWNKGKSMRLESKLKLHIALTGKKAWNKGKKTPKKVREKLSKISKGLRYSIKTEFKKGQFKGNKNPAKQKEIRIKISKAKKGKAHFNQRGANHPLWKGGVTPKNERARKTMKYASWRDAVFARDNWTCKKCGVRGEKIHSHHIYNFADFPKLRTSIANGITLCKKCHYKFHKVYGLKNNTKEKTEEFLNVPYLK